ncbi:MAG: BamA/TamA family outer membrane protein [Gemmatimonadota bacterium]|nr:BamA/TamA family outer membrane protein [Gemmatimonadota bacterium]
MRSIGVGCLLALLTLAALPQGLTGQARDVRGPVVRGLAFDGNKSIDDNILAISIATSVSTFFARSALVRWIGIGERRYFDEVEFQRDVLRILALYRQSGFADAMVDTVVRRFDDAVKVRFVITEGEPIRLAAFTVRGHEDIIATPELMSTFPLRVDDPFNRVLMLASADTVRLRLANRGYPFAEVFRNFDVDLESRTGTIEFEVDPGPKTTVERVEIGGLRDVDEQVVRRSVSVEPGKLFRLRDLYQSQLDLYRTDLFTYVSVSLVDTARSQSAPDSLVTVRIRLAEGPRQRLRLGAGYGTIDCFRTLGSWTLLDFLGNGRSVQLRGQASQIGAGTPLDAGFQRSVCGALVDEDTSRLKLNYNLTATWHEPYVFSRTTSASLTLYGERYTEYRAYLREAVGGEVSVTNHPYPRLPVTLSYGLSYGSTRADPAALCTFLNVCRSEDTRVFTEDRLRATLSLSAVRDVRNSVLNPTGGSWLGSEIRWASPVIGSDSLVRFAKGTLEFSVYGRTGRQSVLSLRAKIGRILPSTLGTGAQDLRFVPPEERFYAGGASTVRGYGQNELGPKVRVLDIIVRTEDRNGQAVQVEDSVIRTSPIGGNELILLNVEYRVPLAAFSNRLAAAVFVDAGRVADRTSEVARGSGLRITPGIGMRLASPLGPIRLDVAFNPYPVDKTLLYKKEGSDLVLVTEAYQPTRSFLGRWRLHFSVGQPF